jgi:hypothetical protein
VTLSLLHLEYLEHSGRLPVYAVLRDLPDVAEEATPIHAPDSPRRREGVLDYAGAKPHYVDSSAGELIEVELFVAVLGAANYTFAEATRTQGGRDWISSHQRTFRFFKGVPRATVCDQLKSGVVVPCRYEPGVQRTYEELHQRGIRHVPRNLRGIRLRGRRRLARFRGDPFRGTPQDQLQNDQECRASVSWSRTEHPS